MEESEKQEVRRFVETGKASKAFLRRLGESEELRRAVEAGFRGDPLGRLLSEAMAMEEETQTGR